MMFSQLIYNLLLKMLETCCIQHKMIETLESILDRTHKSS